LEVKLEHRTMTAAHSSPDAEQTGWKVTVGYTGWS